ncbi:hypothetical protein BpHYR1_011092 [Brachionus plicatilis]|uniref:Uncharacterized protein n=1 Tax=Brachionus plicatilis TaxID=10195 RepID=A0A3M7RY89_BRAPC|nr:hypothetical protein BpHYR1_011092 [Brachionus plicatilis]
MSGQSHLWKIFAHPFNKLTVTHTSSRIGQEKFCLWRKTKLKSRFYISRQTICQRKFIHI